MKHYIIQFKTIIPALLLLATATATAQTDTTRSREGIETYTSDDRSMELKFIAQVHVADVEASLADYLRLGAGVSADYLFPRYLSVNASYRGTYYSLLKQDAVERSFTQNDLRSFSVASGGIRLHIRDGAGRDKRRMSRQLFWKMRDGKRGATRYYVKHTFPCRRIIGARGGIYYSTAPVAAYMTSSFREPSSYGSVRTTDGSVLKGEYYTNSRSTGFYAGITHIINMNVRTSNDLSGSTSETRVEAMFKETYADIIFANTTIDPFIVAGKQYPITANTAGSFDVVNIGWRVGGRLISTRRLINMGVNYEVGSRPGIARKGGYICLGFNVALMK